MNLNRKLIDNLNDKVWYNSKLDKNGVFQANILSKKGGSKIVVNYPLVSYVLPDKTNTYILLSLGTISVANLGLEFLGRGWISTQDLFNNNAFFLCFSLGRKFNIINSYIQLTKNNELLIALDYFSNLDISTVNTNIYVRFYSNIYFNNPSYNSGPGLSISNFIVTPNSSLAYLAFGIAIPSGLSSLVFKNGLLLPDGLPSYSSLVTGDILEVISDPSISYKQVITISNLPVYYSDTDTANKVIVSLDIVNDNVFVADTEFFITGTTASGQRVGGYFPRINIPIIRQLTYKDFGLNAQLVQNSINTLSQFNDVGILVDVSVLIIRRTNDTKRTDVNDSCYISDLMNLPASIRQLILTGIYSNLPIWKASNLETCPFNTFLQHPYQAIVESNFFGVYSRKEARAYLEDVINLNNGNWGLPVICLADGQLISYDSNGKNPSLLQVNRLTGGLGYSGNGLQTFLPFTSNNTLELEVPANDTSNTTVSGNFGIMVLYVNGSLRVATPGIDYTLIDHDHNNTTTIIWSNTLQTYQRYIRSASNGVAFEATLSIADTMNGLDVYNGNIPVNDIGLGNLLVWLNGDYLIYGLDYVLYNSKIFLTSKRTSWTSTFSLLVVYTGLPSNQLEYKDTTTFGFVKYNSILEDGKYDLISFREKLIFIDGAVYSLNEINAKENYQDIPDVTVTPFINGTAYAIVDKPQFVRDDILDLLTNTRVYESELDVKVSNFLSVIDPQPIPTGLIVIPSRYEVVSVLMHRLIHDITNGTLVGLTLSVYNNDHLYTLLAPYMWMLNIDLTQIDLDLNYVIFSPSWNTGYSMDTHQFNFLLTVNAVVLGNKVQGLNTYISVV